MRWHDDQDLGEMSSRYSHRPRSHDDFEIAIICALQVEHDAIEAVLDEVYDNSEPSYRKTPGDQNAYTLGQMNDHPVVIAYMPGIGKANAAAVASGIRSTFPSIRVALITGICGGAPKTPDGADIFLGDAIISTTVLQMDFVRQYPDRRAIKHVAEGNLPPPNAEIRSFIKKLSGPLIRSRLENKMMLHLEEIRQKSEYCSWRLPDVSEDRLYKTGYRHKHHLPSDCASCAVCLTDDAPVCVTSEATSCELLGCGEEYGVDRTRLVESTKPRIHLGVVASGDAIIKSAKHRDQLAQQTGAIAFEMEAAGTW